ncbi:10 kDa chaperonin [Morella rubra]|uniref:10 kDa chaperonin n=1 Tax=Morella rubra TaxID=262757 RepID=A0A6A1VRY2_9ROSI|nr:10 kDa chaperonin [Morella rubra]KAB1215573.1 10 kDa chaperonin [Morella rubra]
MNPLDVIRRTDPRRQREVEEASSSHSTDFLLLSAQSPFRVRMAKRLIPTFNRVLVEKILPPSKTNSGILLPETITKLNPGKVVAVGPGAHDRDGNLIPVSVKEGDNVLLPEFGGTQVLLGDKE